MIYFIQGEVTRLVKIGYTSKFIHNRMPNLQTGSPDRLVFLGGIPGTVGEEQLLHERFEKCHSHGEWFDPVDHLMKFIDTNTIKDQDACHEADNLIKVGKLTMERALQLSADEIHQLFVEHLVERVNP